jgi:hypothetical protein
MKYQVLAILSILTSIVVNAHASAWPPKNTLCVSARVSELSINQEEICHQSEATTKPEFKKALLDLADINTKAANLFNIPLAKLFPLGIPVEITTSHAGINGHARVGSNAIAVYTYPHPERWLNRGVYAHELGHALTFSNHPQIPAALKSMFRTHFSETIADTIAMALVGEETSHETQLPLCFSTKRITYHQSYVTTVGFFDSFYQSHVLNSCCQQFRDFNDDTKIICENINQDEGGEPVDLPPYDMSRFDIMAKKPQPVEEHRIGIPINSFLLTLGQVLGKNLFQEFLQNTNSAKSREFECSLKGTLFAEENIKAYAYPLQDQMFAIRSGLKAEQKISYDVMWTELGLNAAVIYDEKNLAEAAERNSLPAFIRAIKTRTLLFKNKKHCAEILDNIDENGLSDRSCEIKCVIAQ